MQWTPERSAELSSVWYATRGDVSACAEVLGVTRNSILGRSRVQSLQFFDGPRAHISSDHPAATEGRTKFRSRVAEADGNVLKPGEYQRKLGAVVAKGRWRGMPIYSLTLEERATCPRECAMWLSCYGNSMGRAKRYRQGSALEADIICGVAELASRYPAGFVVRLHILGDFYSEAYVRLWALLLVRHPALRIFGYSAWKPGTQIGTALERVRHDYSDRFCVRVSGSRRSNGAIVVEEFSDAGNAIPCPVETGRAKNCASCALCWTAKKSIAFRQH